MAQREPEHAESASKTCTVGILENGRVSVVDIVKCCGNGGKDQ